MYLRKRQIQCQSVWLLFLYTCIYRNTIFFKELLRLFAEYWLEFSPSIFKIDEFETKETQRIIREMWNFLMRND